jgi:hypothetical protein
MPIVPDNEVTRLEKRQRGLQRVASAINDLTIYGIFNTNFPKLVGALEHSKDHIKVELQATKKRIIELSGDTIEEVDLTDKVIVNNPVIVDHSIEIPDHDE